MNITNEFRVRLQIRLTANVSTQINLKYAPSRALVLCALQRSAHDPFHAQRSTPNKCQWRNYGSRVESAIVPNHTKSSRLHHQQAVLKRNQKCTESAPVLVDIDTDWAQRVGASYSRLDLEIILVKTVESRSCCRNTKVFPRCLSFSTHMYT